MLFLGLSRISASRRPLRGLVLACLSIAVLLFGTSSALAADAEILWNANTEGGVLGYRVYIGMSPTSFVQSVDVGNNLSFQAHGLNPGTTYYFAVTAYNSAGESAKSSPTSVSVPSGPDNDRDGIIDADDPDDDNDGLSDVAEASYGTNAFIADTDADGVNDGQEIIDGTNPLDAGSGEPQLSQRICTEWNGFLTGLWNIAELVNLSNHSLRATVTLYSQQGAPLSQQAYDLLPGQQQDSLVHDFVGRTVNAYGNVCITHDGQPGDLDGRMVYYRTASPLSVKLGEQFDFAFALPFSNGKMGKQHVLFDTVQRSTLLSDRSNLVANWIQISNFGTVRGTGIMRFYASNGLLLGQRAISLAPSERLDVSAHQFGKGQTGFVEWEPSVSTIPYQLRNTRYIYDNAGSSQTFASGFQQEGAFASGADLVVPFTTESQSAVLQGSNVLNTPLTVIVSVYGDTGAPLLSTSTFNVGPKGTFTVQLEKFIRGRKGFVQLHTGAPNSLLGGVIQYGRTRKGQITFMDLVPAKPATGLVLRGSYNTYMGQRSYIWALNTTGAPQVVAVSSVRSDGVTTIAPTTFTLPAHGYRVLQVPDVDHYGVVTVQAAAQNTIVSWVQRVRPDFVVPTPVRE